jgi:hypothetical protein
MADKEGRTAAEKAYTLRIETDAICLCASHKPGVADERSSFRSLAFEALLYVLACVFVRAIGASLTS